MQPHADEAQPWAWLQALRLQPATAAAERAGAPVTTRLVVAGVSLALLTWRRLPDERQLPGSGAAHGTSLSRRSSGSGGVDGGGGSNGNGGGGGESAMAEGRGMFTTSTPPSVFAASEPAGGQQLPPREHFGEASRRRKRLRAPHHPHVTGQNNPATSFNYQAHEKAAHEQQHWSQPRQAHGQHSGKLDASPQRESSGDAMPGLHFSGRPTAEYVILQQWGLEVTLAVLPPGAQPDRSSDAAAATGRPPGLQHNGAAGGSSIYRQDTHSAARFMPRIHEQGESDGGGSDDDDNLDHTGDSGIGAQRSKGFKSEDGRGLSGAYGGVHGAGAVDSPLSGASWSIPAAGSGAAPGQAPHAASEPAASAPEGARQAAAAAQADTRLQSEEVRQHQRHNEQLRRPQRPGITRPQLPTGTPLAFLGSPFRVIRFTVHF